MRTVATAMAYLDDKRDGPGQHASLSGCAAAGVASTAAASARAPSSTGRAPTTAPAASF